MQLNKHKPGFIFLALLFILGNCQKVYKEKSCDPYKKFEANFKIGYQFLNGHFAESDTIVNFSSFFEADSTYESCEWQIGNGIYNTKKVRMVFPLSALGQKIPVQLIAKGEKNPCNPNDTVKKELALLYSKELNDINGYTYEERHLVELPFFGKWHGYFEDAPKDTFTVTINNNGKAPFSATDRFHRFRIYNLPKGCSVKQEHGAANCEPIIDTIQKYYGYVLEEVSYNAFYVSGNSFFCCPAVDMFGRVNTQNNTIAISCDIYPNSNNTITKKTRLFKGKKLKL